MERRDAIKTLASTIGLAVVPNWLMAWSPATVYASGKLLNILETNTLAEIVATIIPEGDIPGAKALGVDTLINKIVTDCYEPKQQADFRAGLEQVENLAQAIHTRSFAACDSNQKLAILKTMEGSADSTKKGFFNQIKNLTVQGYTSSEYVQTKHLNYVMAPGHYYGCVPV
jgi:hypothetical protein